MTPVLPGELLPAPWTGQEAWRVLETNFDCGQHFLACLQHWKADPQPPHLLHYVSLTASPVSKDALLACAGQFPELQTLAHALAAQWNGLLPGFHRFSLEQGRVLLTLCVGEPRQMLREQSFLADAILLDPARSATDATTVWSIWTVKALARCCRRGTLIAITDEAASLKPDLQQCGFTFAAQQRTGEFNPRWAIKHSRHATAPIPERAGRCVVIGAGLAGASVASSLARRGWQVQVLDAGDAPAAGASGLPVGLVVDHVSADDCTQSRLSRSGVRLMLQQASALLRKGLDWDDSGVLEQRLDGSHASAPPMAVGGLDSGAGGLWHPKAAWLKPAPLVRAWLAQASIQFKGKANVVSLEKSGAEWRLLDASRQELGRAERVVFANAGGAWPLLDACQAGVFEPDRLLDLHLLPTMHGLRGQLSWAMHPPSITPADMDFPTFPVNGSGSVIPGIPLQTDSNDVASAGKAWFIGSSYQADSAQEYTVSENHLSNLARLKKLLPKLGDALQAQFLNGTIEHWKNTRCVTADRLPLVGPLDEGGHSGLWICAGMGSRGMRFSVLCAELLAAHWGNEPLPVSASLAHTLRALRGRGRAAPTVKD